MYRDEGGLLSSQTTLVWLRPRNLSYEQHHSDPQIFRSFGRHNYLRHQQGLCLLKFVGGRRVKREQKNLQRLLNLPLRIGTNDHLMQTEAQLREYFSGTRRSFDTALHTHGTSFQNEAWQGFAPNPTRQNGQVSSREQAARMGKPSAVRAVANAADESLRK